jgi:hypothetical protein
MNRCIFCLYNYTTESDTIRHLKAGCSVFNTLSAFDAYILFLEYKKIKVNTITNLNTEYINNDKMIQLIEKYDNNLSDKNLKLLLSHYIKDILQNKNHKENHCIKYIKKRPLTFNIIIDNEISDNNTIIKNVKDTCEYVSLYILSILNNKYHSFITTVKDSNYDISLYEDTIILLKKKLTKKMIEKALNYFLRQILVKDKIMKFS